MKSIAIGAAGAGIWSVPAHAAAEPLTSFAAGLAHPIGGIDHILAMVAVGMWGVSAGGRARWVWPAMFVATMLAGYVAAILGLQLPWAPAVISSSILVLGLMVALALKPPVWIGAVVVALFAFFHGHAHGTEATAARLAAYGAGFALSTAALHAAGIGLAITGERALGRVAVRAMGALTIVGGLALFGA